MIMERLTSKRAWENASQDLASEMGYSHIWKRLEEIEDILGDTYDLDRLRELVEVDREGRCVVHPDFVYKVGETMGIIKVPYRRWMDRYIGTKFYITKEEAEAAEAALRCQDEKKERD